MVQVRRLAARHLRPLSNPSGAPFGRVFQLLLRRQGRGPAGVEAPGVRCATIALSAGRCVPAEKGPPRAEGARRRQASGDGQSYAAGLLCKLGNGVLRGLQALRKLLDPACREVERETERCYIICLRPALTYSDTRKLGDQLWYSKKIRRAAAVL